MNKNFNRLEYLCVFNKDKRYTQGSGKSRRESLVHGLEKLFVVLGSMHLILQELHRIDYA